MYELNYIYWLGSTTPNLTCQGLDGYWVESEARCVDALERVPNSLEMC